MQPERIHLVAATPQDIPVLRNMSTFYIYDVSEHMGCEAGWGLAADGSYDSGIDMPAYFADPDAHPFLIRYGEQLAGFAIVDRRRCGPETDFNMGQFFIARSFKRRGVGRIVARRLFDRFPGSWQVTVLVGNDAALRFWESVIGEYTGGLIDRSRGLIPDEMHVLRFPTGAGA